MSEIDEVVRKLVGLATLTKPKLKTAKKLAKAAYNVYLCGNKTCHASHKNGATGQVFDFIYSINYFKP